MNILKIPLILMALLSSIVLFSCSKDTYFSGISETSLNEIKENCYGYNLRENAFCVLVIQTGASAISMEKKTSTPTLPHPKVNISGVNIA